MTNLYYERLLNRIEKIERLCNEGKQVGTLYHICSLKNYRKYILPKNQLSASGNFENALYGGKDWISFTRDKSYAVLGRSTNASVLLQLVVDGDSLSDNYKIGPYNDFAFDIDGNPVTDGSDEPQYREQEEAVKGPIKNFSRYLKEIRFDIRCKAVDLQDTLDYMKEALPDKAVYYNFIDADDNSPVTNKIIIESGVHNGCSKKEFISLMEKALQKRSKRLR